MQDMIHLRPHHLLCLQAFRGKGYSESFVKKMTEVHARLRENPKLEIRLAKGAAGVKRSRQKQQKGTDRDGRYHP